MNNTTKPYTFQAEDVLIMEEMRGRVLLASEMGLGKTFQSLLFAKRNPSLRPIVVVCPASLKWNWEREAKIHVGMRAEVLEGTKPATSTGLHFHSDLIIVNYDILHAWLVHLRLLKPKIVIADEIHYAMSRKSRRSKSLDLLSKGVPCILGLSGTPLTNRPLDLWFPLHIIRPDLYPSLWTYAFQFCAPKKKFYGWDFSGASNLDKLHKTLTSTCMIRRRKIDVLKELPEKQRTVIPLDIIKRREYTHAVKDFRNWIKGRLPNRIKGVEKSEGLVKLGHLKRLAARLKFKSATNWINDWLTESDGKLVVFAVHRKIIKKLHDKFKNLSVVVDGSVVGKKRQLTVDQFQTDKKIRLFIGNIKAAGIGLNLTAAQTVVFAELGWTPGEHIQAEDRIHRIGQTGHASIVYLVARRTIEEHLVEIIQRKQGTLNTVLDSGKGENLDIFDQLCIIIGRDQQESSNVCL